MNFDIIVYLTCDLKWILQDRLQSKQIYKNILKTRFILTLGTNSQKSNLSKDKMEILKDLGTKIRY